MAMTSSDDSSEEDFGPSWKMSRFSAGIAEGCHVNVDTALAMNGSFRGMDTIQMTEEVSGIVNAYCRAGLTDIIVADSFVSGLSSKNFAVRVKADSQIVPDMCRDLTSPTCTVGIALDLACPAFTRLCDYEIKNALDWAAFVGNGPTFSCMNNDDEATPGNTMMDSESWWRGIPKSGFIGLYSHVRNKNEGYLVVSVSGLDGLSERVEALSSAQGGLTHRKYATGICSKASDIALRNALRIAFIATHALGFAKGNSALIGVDDINAVPYPRGKAPTVGDAILCSSNPIPSITASPTFINISDVVVVDGDVATVSNGMVLPGASRRDNTDDGIVASFDVGGPKGGMFLAKKRDLDMAWKNIGNGRGQCWAFDAGTNGRSQWWSQWIEAAAGASAYRCKHFLSKNT